MSKSLKRIVGGAFWHVKHFPSILKNKIESERVLKDSIPVAMEKFLPEEERSNPQMRKFIANDILKCFRKYHSNANEYFLFGFRGQNHEYRNSFVTDLVKDNTLLNVIGGKVFFSELKDKYNFYKLTSKYFNRDVMFVNPKEGDLQSFKLFAQKHPVLFVKENASSLGRGVSSHHVASEKEAEDLYNSLKESGGDWMIEEKIVQVPEMAQWNESSVNTVRLPSILNNGEWTPIGPFLRTGRKGAVVDNAGAGGVFAVINPETGVVITDGIDEDGKYYAQHPDSGIAYKGWQVPHWKELLSLAEEIQRSIPQHKYVGWDFALTDKGWTLIEGNWGQLVSQYNDHIGLKWQFFDLLGVKGDK